MTNKEFQQKVLDLLASFDERLKKLEKDSHPQGVLVDPDLTEALRKLGRGVEPIVVNDRACDFQHRKIC